MFTKDEFITKYCGSWSKDMSNMPKVGKDFNVFEDKFKES